MIRNAHRAGLVEQDLHNRGLDEDLLARRIELLDDPAQRLVVLEGRHNEQRVRGRIERNANVALEEQRGRV